MFPLAVGAKKRQRLSDRIGPRFEKEPVRAAMLISAFRLLWRAGPRLSFSFVGGLLLYGLMVGLVPAAATAQPRPAPIHLVPHRAVYDISLDDARSASGITGVDGRMVFEFSGSKCAGYTINMRMVTQMNDSQGQSDMRDIRSSTWEQGDGKKFRFQSAQYVNDKLGDVTMGRATRDNADAPVRVRLSKPSPAELTLPAKVLFPTQQSIAILRAAEAGKSMLQSKFYDGSEKGRKLYDTTAFIGKRIPPGTTKNMEAPAKAHGLDKLSAWPVSIGYFNTLGGDLTPAYQIDFLLYSNGVSRELRIDYGDFTIYGHMSQLEYLTPEKCDAKAGD